MKIYTSYFAQLRNFPKNFVPLSTAIWQPKYFMQPDGKPWLDKRNVINGLTAPPFAPEMTSGDENCGGRPCKRELSSCGFLRTYCKQLDKLDFNDIMARLERAGIWAQQFAQFDDEPVIVLMVYEAIDNPCSERRPIQEWFAAHGVEVKEWQVPKKEKIITKKFDF